jgi:hypothetical protein
MGQVLAAYNLDRKLLKKMEESNAAEFQYPTTDWRYRLRHCFFHTKIVLTIGAATISAVHLGTEICRVKGPRYEKESQEKGASR